MKVWNEIKNYKDLKPYVYGLKKEYTDKIKEFKIEIERLLKDIDILEYAAVESDIMLSETIELLKKYLDSDYENGIDELTIENEKLLSKITGKCIQDLIK